MFPVVLGPARNLHGAAGSDLVHHFVSYADLYDAGQDSVGRDVPLQGSCLPLCGGSQLLFSRITSVSVH